MHIEQWGGMRAHQEPGFPLRHHFFERGGGFSASPYATLNCAYRTEDPQSPRNRAQILEALKLEQASLRILNPCHGREIAFVSDSDWQGETRDVLIGTDAAVTFTPGTWFMMSTADCLPLLITDKANSFLGIVHLGWRNIVDRFTTRVFEAIAQRRAFSPGDLRIAIGPSIKPCCYRYDSPVQLGDPFWAPFLNHVGGDKYAIDLVSATVAELRGLGVHESDIAGPTVCTGCRNDLFFSCYLEGYKSGRFATLAGLVAR